MGVRILQGPILNIYMCVKMSKTPTLVSKSAIPGSVIAICLSFVVNKSILWCILHAIFGWLYVIYWLFSYTKFSEWILQWVVK